jgi:hypothetical protein
VRFVPALVISAALILAAPVIGQLRAWLQNTFPGNYRTILIAGVGVCVSLAVLAALTRIRTRNTTRYALLALALAIGMTYAMLSRTGDAAVDAVERFHFVEYGVVTLLFYLAWRPVGDASLFILPILAGLLVGTLEEWLQWFVPARVGEARDVFLNLWAIVCGLLFSVALDPPERFDLMLRRESWIHVRRAAALVTLVFALFFNFAHLGYQIDAAPGGPFRSTYTRERLVQLAGERAERWRSNPPLTWSRYSREDQYFSEGIALVRQRNSCWDAGDMLCAWRRNAILEQFYAPVLDVASYVSATGHRWPRDQREEAERRVQATAASATSAADDGGVIVTWSKPMFWAIVATAIAALLFL